MPRAERKYDAELQPSRSQRKRESTALQKTAETVARLSPAEWERLPLTEELREALHALRGISSREARRRHMQYLGRLMREADGTALEEALAGFSAV